MNNKQKMYTEWIYNFCVTNFVSADYFSSENVYWICKYYKVPYKYLTQNEEMYTKNGKKIRMGCTLLIRNKMHLCTCVCLNT